MPNRYIFLFLFFALSSAHANSYYFYRYLSTDSLGVSSDNITISHHDNDNILVEIGNSYTSLATNITDQYNAQDLNGYKAYLDTNISAVFFVNDGNLLFIHQNGKNFILYETSAAYNITTAKTNKIIWDNAYSVANSYMAMINGYYSSIQNKSTVSSEIYNRIRVPDEENYAHYKPPVKKRSSSMANNNTIISYPILLSTPSPYPSPTPSQPDYRPSCASAQHDYDFASKQLDWNIKNGGYSATMDYMKQNAFRQLQNCQ